MRVGVAIVVALACAAAAYPGVRATHDLEWPGDPDFTRDIGAAEAMAAGHPLSDPLYRHEWIWYNPMVPATVAVVASATDLPIPRVYARLGAYLNLLAPLALFLLVAAWRGPLVALAAVVSLLYFVSGTEPGWLSASYSPWLFPMHVGQGAFYLAMAALAAAWRKGATGAFAVAGFLLGAAFLTHTAPALLIGGAMTLEFAHRWRSHAGNRRRYLAHGTVFLVVALVLASPFLFSIVWHYRLHILNPAPVLYGVPELSLDNAWNFWTEALTLSPVGLVAAIGWIWIVQRRHELESRLVLGAALTNVALLGYSYLLQTEAAAAAGLIAIVPGHHFLYYLRAFEAIAFAVGLSALADWGGRISTRLLPDRWVQPEKRILAGLVVLAVVAAAWRYPAYASRYDFTGGRLIAKEMFADTRLRAMYHWLRENTSRDDVVLAPTNLGQSVIGTAGRKVVVVEKFFSNPYVDWAQRARDHEEMSHALVNGNWTAFQTHAVRYRVRYVAHYGELPPAIVKPSMLSVAWTDGGWVLYRVGT
jgi:hypothetical protein